ncbi:MAG: hypothetical protein JWQ38_1844 [Flavipsychrobacter sp.]|nr:hypothetical protein [Flavipsychrobacter sp.]
MWIGLVCVLTLLISNTVFAQQATTSAARQFAADKNYTKALDQYKELYGLHPDSVYKEYLRTLIEARNYKLAEEIIAKQMTMRDNPFLHIDLGGVYEKEKKDNKAKEEYEGIMNMINGDDMVTQKVVKEFMDAGRDDYAILAYEKACKLLNTTILYVNPLAKLYAKTNQLDKALDIIIVNNQGQGVNLENAKSLLLEIVGNDAAKLQFTQKSLVKKINEHPENPYFAELLTWIYIQKNDWDGALIQIEAIDERNQENGMRLMNLARTAAGAGQYDAAGKAYDDVVMKGAGQPFYLQARSEKINVAYTKLAKDPAYKQEDVANIAKLYDSFLAEFPRYYIEQTAGDYAALETQYAGNPAKGIEILQKAIAMPGIRRDRAAAFKLQMGDYYVLNGKIWDASLSYSQVDKEFRQDALGEDARFRNSRLAYYRGDFEYAQSLLSILKASTSELIANDALYLSVLITENVEDSNKVPLERFANAGLMLFQNKDKEAETILDSITAAFPKHPLNDDILMMRADIAIKHREYDKAIGYLKTIKEKYGEDVLGDDAMFKMAGVYQDYLHQNDLAKKYYEDLIIDYPGSTWAQTARQKIAELTNGSTP